MKLREFCETALSNDLVGFVDDISNPKEEPKEVFACYRLLMDNHPLLYREIDRFTYGKAKCANRQVLLIQLKEKEVQAINEKESNLIDYIMENMHWCPFSDNSGVDFSECVGFREKGCKECIYNNTEKLKSKD